MKMYSAKYKGDQVIELPEDIDLPMDIEILILVPGQDDERKLHKQLHIAAESAFGKLWNNEEDEVWNEYL